MPRSILVLNAGSSSIKFRLYGDGAALTLLLRGQISSIGRAPGFNAEDGLGKSLIERHWPQDTGYEVLVAFLMEWVEGFLGDAPLEAVGHRVVHGGAEFDHPVRLNDEVMQKLDALSPLAPLHQPHNLAPVRLLFKSHQGLPQVACFDTTFHRSHPEVADIFALPKSYAARGIRRYGFHGLSYEYIVRQLPRVAPQLAGGKIVVAHLGNGASMCAIKAGKSIDSTMGFTALEGLMMGTRSGAIDPGVLLHLMMQEGMTAAEVEHLLYHDSGLLGVSGISGDMRDLLASDHPDAEMAIRLYVYRISQWLGALTASLGGLDGLVFTAGIGENAAPIRAQVCRAAAWLGVELDEAANTAGNALISKAGSRVSVWVIPTDEEYMIASHTRDILKRSRI
jgi:acetate kinase